MRLESGRKFFYQWELDQRLEVPEGCTLVHYDNGTTDKALSVEVKDGLAAVPNIMLQVAADIRCYAWDGTTVVEHIVLHVEGRPMPAEYFYTETEVRRYDILLEELEKKGAYYTPAVDAEGNLSWGKSMERMPDVPGGNIRGPEGPQGPQGDPGKVNIDDTKVGADAWSSKNIVDKLCPSFEESGSAVRCEPVEGYPLEVVSALAPKADDSYHGVITLTQCGKNFYDKTKYPFSPKNWINQNTGDVVGGNNGYSCTVDYIPISHLRGKTITLNHTPGGSSPGMAFYDVNKTYISGKKGTAVVVPDTAVYMRFTVNDAYADGEDVQWEIGSVATAYEPYKGQTFTADFTNAPEMEGEGFYNWNTGLMGNGASIYLHNLTTGDFVMADEEEADTIVRNIPALPGTNTLYSDCGDTEVSGKADPVRIIEKLTNAILAQGGTV